MEDLNRRVDRLFNQCKELEAQYEKRNEKCYAKNYREINKYTNYHKFEKKRVQCNICNRRNHTTEECYYADLTIICGICQKRNHTENECWYNTNSNDKIIKNSRNYEKNLSNFRSNISLYFNWLMLILY